MLSLLLNESVHPEENQFCRAQSQVATKLQVVTHLLRSYREMHCTGLKWFRVPASLERYVLDVNVSHAMAT